ncbi:MAG: hypothetical protein U1D55_10310 [Phycisphaerae bacterium]
MIRPTNFFRHVSRGYGAVARLSLACYLVSAFGLLPGPGLLRSAHDPAERFPCEVCGCGCGSARECWSRCCCHTAVERLAWAIRNGVQPPANVTFSDAEWAAARRAAEPKRVCASCGEAGTKRATGSQQKTRRQSDRTGSGMPSFSALKCKNLSVLIGIAIPPALPLCAIDPLRPPLRERISALGDWHCASRALETPAPPPRVARHASNLG